MIYYVVIAVLIALDQCTKLIVDRNMAPGESIGVLDGIFHITHIHNTGAAFSFFTGHAMALGIVTGVALLVGLVFIYLKRNTGGALLMISLSMIIGGGIGNLIDRFARGYVVDFLDFRVFPVFNMADIFVTVGCALLCVYALRGGKEDAR